MRSFDGGSFSGFLLLLAARLLLQALHVLPCFFQIQEQHVGIDDGGLLHKTDALDTIHDLGKGIAKGFAFDIDDSLEILVLPVELATDVENILVPLVGIGVIHSFSELVLVNGVVPYCNKSATKIPSMRDKQDEERRRETHIDLHACRPPWKRASSS